MKRRGTMDKRAIYQKITRTFMLGIIAFVLTGSAGAETRKAAIGHKAPPFELETLTGDAIELSAFARRPLYINVFATWCPPCRKEMPLIARTLPAFSRHVAFLAVDAQEGVAIVRRYVASVPLLATHVAIDDGQFVASYGATSIPESVFVDRLGIVRAIVRGPIDEATLRRDLAAISR